MFGALVTLWLLAWTFLVLSIDVHFAIQVGRTARAASFPSVEGQITRSAIERMPNAGQKGDQGEPRLKITYRYTHRDRTWEGDRLSFWNSTWSGGLRQMERRLEQFPVGQRVTVFFDPNDPANSALDRQLGGGPLFLALLLTPFNLVMIGGWAWLRRRGRGLIGRLIHADGNRWIIQRTLGDPILTGVIVAGLISLVEIMLTSVGQWHESVAALLVLWAALLIVSFIAVWHAKRTQYFEPARMICDNTKRSVTWLTESSTDSGPAYSASQWRRTELADQVRLDHLPEETSGYAVRLVFEAPAGGETIRTVLETDNAIEAAGLSEWLEDWFRSHTLTKTV